LPKIHAGPDATAELAALECDIVLNAVAGSQGLRATLAALTAGRIVALANKESLIAGGPIVGALAGEGQLVPVDSEHSALAQCLRAGHAAEVRRLVITASGGPFRRWTSKQLENATLADALQHPTWRMGRKITVDSATLANKALEVIEAHFLFGLPYERIEVVVHPQSVVHSFVEFVDGSVLAQMGVPSMELPVLYALTFPDRAADTGVPPFDPVELSPLTFEKVRARDFPALELGTQAGRLGGAAPAVFNAANEQAVAFFLEGAIRFGDIPRAIESALGKFAAAPSGSREAILDADASARRHVQELFRC
jgi:1-deoxy-D-xylulose-5-phosphate reductoisomerase